MNARMMGGIAVAAVLLTAGGVVGESRPFIYSHSFQVPGWSGQGLASDGNLVYWQNCDTGVITAFDPNTGATIREYAPPKVVASLGLACDGTYLYALDSSYVGRTALIQKIDIATGNITNTFSVEAYEAVSAAFINGQIVLGVNNGLEFVDSDNGSVVREVVTPCIEPFYRDWNGLTEYGSILIGAYEYSGKCVKIDPITGQPIGPVFGLRGPGQGIRGLASDGTRLFSAGVTWGELGYDHGFVDVYVPISEAQSGAFADMGTHFCGNGLDASMSYSANGIASFLWDLDTDGVYDDASGQYV